MGRSHIRTNSYQKVVTRVDAKGPMVAYPYDSYAREGWLVANGDYQIRGENRAARPSELRPSLVKRDMSEKGRGQAVVIYLFGKDGAFSGQLVLVQVHQVQPARRHRSQRLRVTRNYRRERRGNGLAIAGAHRPSHERQRRRRTFSINWCRGLPSGKGPRIVGQI